MRRKIYLLALIPLFAVFLLGAGCASTPAPEQTNSAAVENVQTKSITVTFNFGDGITDDVALPSSTATNAYEVVTEATKAAGYFLDIKESAGLGKYINEISDKKGGDDGKYWLYFVNGTAATQGIEAQEVKDGDKIEFRFTKS